MSLIVMLWEIMIKFNKKMKCGGAEMKCGGAEIKCTHVIDHDN